MLCSKYNSSRCSECDELMQDVLTAKNNHSFSSRLLNGFRVFYEIFGDDLDLFDKSVMEIISDNRVKDFCYTYISFLFLRKHSSDIRKLNIISDYNSLLSYVMYYLYCIYGSPDEPNNIIKNTIVKNINEMNSISIENQDKIKQLVNKEVKELFKNKIDNTTKERLIQTRIGQSILRQKLLHMHSYCMVCGLDNTSFLYASHSKPWSESNNTERLDVYNGLLLCTPHNDLYDKGYISFNDDGSIIISKILEKDVMIRFGITPEIKINIERKHKKYLKYHRKNVFEKFLK